MTALAIGLVMVSICIVDAYPAPHLPSAFWDTR